MRFAELQLLKYGHFENCCLGFPKAQTDLHVVFGANEAGKSTTMAAISDLLFGFPHITDYDFRFDKQLLRVGARVQAEGLDFVCRRKKGRSGTLLDDQERILDEGRIAATLSGYSAESFQRMFSLDHMRLRDGGRAILAAQDDIGQAIFAAGSGLVGVAAVLDSLEAESKEIWTKRAGERRYYAAQERYEEARARQKASQIKPAAWDEVREDLARLDKALAEAGNRRNERWREREDVERQRRTLPHATLFLRAQAELGGISNIPILPPNGAEILNQVTMALATADTEIALAEAERDKLRAALDALVVDYRLLEHSDEIEGLRETKGAVDQNLSELPRRRTELATRVRRLAELQRELGWPVEAAQKVKDRLPQRIRLVEVRGLLEARSALDATLASASADETAARQALEILQTRQIDLPAARNLRELSAALKFARSFGDLDGVIGAAEREANRRAATLATNLTQLTPWAGAIDSLRNLILPGSAEVAAAHMEMTQAEATLAEAKRNVQTELDRKSALKLQQTHLTRDDSAVSPDTIHNARENRDALWREVRAHLTAERALPDPGAAVVEFELRSNVADGAADRRYAAAEQSGRLTALQEELERNALALTQNERRVTEAEAEVAALGKAWRALLAPSGLQMKPKDFSAWSERRRRAIEAADEVYLAQVALQEVNRHLEGAKTTLADALAAAGAPSDQPFGLLLQLAEQLETGEDEIAQRRSELRTEATAAEHALKRAESKQLALRGSLAEWEVNWATSVRAAGLDGRNSQAVIRAQLDILEELRSDVDELLKLEQRITAMEADIAAFGERVTSLEALCGRPGGSRPPADLLVELTSAGREAKATQTRRADLEKQFAEAERRFAAASESRARSLAQLRPLSDMVGSVEQVKLVDAVQQSDRARHLRGELDRLTGEILNAGPAVALEVLVAESQNADAAVLTVRSNELQDELAGLSDTLAQLTGERATVQANFARLDDGPSAAIAAADAEQARAEMVTQAEAYVRKRAEVALLRWTIAQYRAEKQTPLLKRASGLFSKLTIGRYTELLVDRDGDSARLAGLSIDQTVVPADKMSEGTVDQLFLALRLSAVEDAVAAGAKLPFLADDLFINYDDTRAAAGFQVLAELAATTQVLFFTHHQHLAGVAEAALAPLKVSRCELA